MDLIISAYAWSLIGGGILAWVATTALFKRINVDHPAETEKTWWGLPLLLGLAERGIVTTLIIWTPTLVAAFIGGWVLVKLAGNWGALLKEPTTHHRASYMASLLGSVVSLGWAAVVTGLLFPESIRVISN